MCFFHCSQVYENGIGVFPAVSECDCKLSTLYAKSVRNIFLKTVYFVQMNLPSLALCVVLIPTAQI